MKNKMKIFLTGLFLVGFAGLAFADGRDFTFRSVSEMPTTTTAPTSSDYKFIFNASDNRVEKYTATSEKLAGAFNGTVGATTPSTGVFTALSATTGVDGILGGVTPAAATVTTLSASTSVATPLINNGASGTAGTLNIFPATAANGKIILSAINNSGAFNTTLTNKNIGQSTVYSLPECSAATCDLLTTTSAQTITGVNTFGAASNIVSKTSTSSTDINPPYDNRILGNPVVKYVYGSCAVAAVNGGTCIPLALASGRTIAVLNYDIVAAGSAATCTGILLEDTTGTPVVVSTIAAAALTSGAHNFPGLANNVLGVGFGAGSGLTVSQGLQIKVNGSNCATTTAFQYAITYTVQ